VTTSRAPTSRNIWKTALDGIKDQYQQIMAFAVLGIFLPQVILNYFFDITSIQAGQLIQTLSLQENSTINSIMESSIEHFSNFFFGNIFVWAISVGAYFAILEILVAGHRGQKISSLDAIKSGLKSIFPKGFVLSISMILLLVLGQSAIFTLPALILATLGLMAPVIMVSSQKGALTAIWHAIGLKYVKGTGFNTWSVMFGTMSVGAIFYACFSLSHLFLDFALNADSYFALPRYLWINESLISNIYFIFSFLTKIFTTIALVFLPGVTTAMYFAVLKNKEFQAV